MVTGPWILPRLLPHSSLPLAHCTCQVLLTVPAPWDLGVLWCSRCVTCVLALVDLRLLSVLVIAVKRHHHQGNYYKRAFN